MAKWRIGSVDWLKISWNPVKQPDGTRVKVQIATNNDTITWNWRGPDGSSTTYYTKATGQTIFNCEQGKYIRVRFYLESDFGEGSDTFGNKKTVRTPSITDYCITYGKFKKPTAELFSPNGGEDLIKEKYHTITWEAIGDLGSNPINLYYSTNGGKTWTLIVNDIKNNGAYNWTIPNIETATGLVKVSCKDVYGNNVTDVSDINFAIDPPPQKPENEQEQKTEKIDETKDEQKTDDSKDNLTENKQNSKNQKEESNISSIIAISEGFVIIFILIMIILIKRKSKINKNKEEIQKEVKK